jgi:phosphatidylserine decarboxylase
MEHQARRHRKHRRGRWLPHQDALEDWLDGLTEDVGSQGKGVTFHPVVEEFRGLIEGDPIVRMYFTQMIEQVPHTKEYRKRHLESTDQMLRLINEVIRRAPEYNDTGLEGVPLNAVLDWCMGTPAGFAAFRHEPINAMFGKILKAWCEFLSSPASFSSSAWARSPRASSIPTCGGAAGLRREMSSDTSSTAARAMA